MTTTLSAPAITSSQPTTSVQPAAVPTVWRHGLVAGAFAAVATLVGVLVTVQSPAPMRAQALVRPRLRSRAR